MVPSHLIGRYLMVIFDDHALLDGKGDILRCRAVGRLSDVNQTRIKLCHWELPEASTGDKKRNEEHAAILQSTIIDYYEMKIIKPRVTRQ